MPRKMVGYFLLSFLSFCFFTIVFNAMAIAQVSAQQPTPTPKPVNIVPTPTIYNTQPVKANPQVQQFSSLPTPTPTLAATKQVLAIPTQAPQPTATPTETPILPTATPTPTAAPTPQTTKIGTTDLETLFSHYSSQYSVSEDELKKIAGCESGYNTNSDTGLYAGMYQFSAGTWASIRVAMGMDGNPDLRKNPEEAIRTAAFMLSRGEQNAWPNCH